MNTKLVVVIPNEYATQIPVYVKRCNYHAEGIRSFIYDAGLDLHGKEMLNSNTMSLELSKQGYIIMSLDSFNDQQNLVVYLPNEISPNQLEYFKKRKVQLKDFNLSYCTQNEYNEMNIVDVTTTNNPIMDELLIELNNRLITKEKNKKR